jgi:hypothetical protein
MLAAFIVGPSFHYRSASWSCTMLLLLFGLSALCIAPLVCVSALSVKSGGVYRISGGGLTIEGALNVSGIVRIAGEDIMDRFAQLEAALQKQQAQIDAYAELHQIMQTNLSAAWNLIAEQQLALEQTPSQSFMSRISALESAATQVDLRIAAAALEITQLRAVVNVNVTDLGSSIANVWQLVQGHGINIDNLQGRLSIVEADSIAFRTQLDSLKISAISNSTVVSANLLAIQTDISVLSSLFNSTQLEVSFSDQTQADEIASLATRLTALEALNHTTSDLTATVHAIRDLTDVSVLVSTITSLRDFIGSSALVSNVFAALGLTGTSTLVSGVNSHSNISLN